MKTSDAVLVVGSIAFDDLEMPSGSFKDVVGGAATYSSLAASLLAPVRLVGIVGEDFPEAQLVTLRERGIDTQGVERVAGGKTFRWHGRYADDLLSRTSLDTQLNVFADFQPKLPATYASTPFVLLGNIHPKLQLDVVKQVRSAATPKLIAADTMNFWIAGEPGALGELLKKIDLLVINEEEARELSGIHNITRAAADIRRRGPQSGMALIIKRGEYGALVFDDAGVFFTPGYPLEDVYDPTGAGDTFAGGLLGYMARLGDASPASLRRATFFASALASFCVEDIGTKRLGKVTHMELAARIEAFAKLVDYGGNLALSEA